MMHVNNFPPEILEKILYSVDAKTLVPAQRVCKHWKNIIKNVLRSQLFWHHNCLLEIYPAMMMDFQLTTSDRFADDGVVWEKLYKKWTYLCELERFKKYTSIRENTYSSDCCVTDIKVTGNCVVTAINLISQVLIWHTVSEELLLALNHNADVLTMELVDLLHSGPYEGYGYYMDHHLLITGGEDHTIRLFSLLAKGKLNSRFGAADIKECLCLNQHGAPIKFLRAYGSQFLAHSEDGTVSVWKICMPKTVNQIVEAKLQHYILGTDNLHWSLGFGENEITGIWRHNVSLQKIHLPAVQWSVPLPIEFIMKDNKEAGFDGLDVLLIKSCYVFRDSLIILLTVDKQLCISPGGSIYHKYNTMLYLHAHVTAVTLFANILILGTNLGSVYLYRYNKARELLNLDLTAPICYFHLGDQPVTQISINMTDVRPVIAVALGSHWYIIQWKYSFHLNSIS